MEALACPMQEDLRASTVLRTSLINRAELDPCELQDYLFAAA
jgi:hypothetical protein